MERDYLLEIGCEEIPAGFVGPALWFGGQQIAEELKKARLSFVRVDIYGTPRRLTYVVRKLKDRQKASEETVLGPPKTVGYDAKGKPTRAAEGFAKAQGIDVSSLRLFTTDRGEYLGYVREQAARPVGEILPRLVADWIPTIPFKKSMRWGDQEVRFARPVHWIAALYDGQVVPFAFGNVQTGNTGTKSETLTNTGAGPVTISQANVTGTGYSVSGLTLPTTLTASQSVTFTVKFAPASAGTVNGNLSLVSDASNSPLGIALSGTGTTPGQLSVSPTTLNFGNVTVGSHKALTGTLSASSASVTVSSASINSSEFVLSGITLPATLTAGQSAGFTVTFTPQATGSASASLTFTSNATNAPTTQSLTGSGTAATHSVSRSCGVWRRAGGRSWAPVPSRWSSTAAWGSDKPR